MDNSIKNLITFENSVIRRAWHQEQWYFVVLDVVQVLTDSKNPSVYLANMRRRDKAFAQVWGQIATPLLIETTGGHQKINCANTEGVFRIIQSVRSPKAEPFKQWLAKVGYQRIQEIEQPELAIERIREAYQVKGYSEDWIEARLQSISVRKRLTKEWKKRKVKGHEYAILTAEISQAIFGLKPSEHKILKGLKRQSLRDNMTEKEIVFTMLGEIGTREEAVKTDAIGFLKNKEAAIKGGGAANDAMKAYEQSTGRKVLSDKNYLDKKEKGLFGSEEATVNTES